MSFVVFSVVLLCMVKKLGINEPFLYKLVPTVGKIMESYYPEVLEKRDFIEKIVKSEEESFARTLHSGQHFAQGIVADLKEKVNLLSLVQMSSNSMILMGSQLN